MIAAGKRIQEKTMLFWISTIYGSSALSLTISLLPSSKLFLLYKGIILENYKSLTGIMAFFIALVLMAKAIFLREKRVYLLDYAVYEGEDFMRLTKEKQKIVLAYTSFDEEARAFQERVFAASTIGESSLYPPSPMRDFPNNLHRCSVGDALIEAESVVFSCVEEVLRKTGLSPTDIDVLVLNCSLFCPTPSLSAMVVNRFRLRDDVKSFNLGGMGCSAGLIAVALAKDYLRLPENRTALIVSTENTTLHFYRGNDKSMLITNSLFRVGGSAVILSTRRKGALLRLKHVVRTHMGNNDESFRSVFQKMDEHGYLGVRIGREVMEVAGKALRLNVSKLGPKTLPFSEQIRYFINCIAISLLEDERFRGFVRSAALWLFYGGENGRSWLRSLFALKEVEGKHQRYVPDFNKAFDHFCVFVLIKQIVDTCGR